MLSTARTVPAVAGTGPVILQQRRNARDSGQMLDTQTGGWSWLARKEAESPAPSPARMSCHPCAQNPAWAQRGTPAGNDNKGHAQTLTTSQGGHYHLWAGWLGVQSSEGHAQVMSWCRQLGLTEDHVLLTSLSCLSLGVGGYRVRGKLPTLLVLPGTKIPP